MITMMMVVVAKHLDWLSNKFDFRSKRFQALFAYTSYRMEWEIGLLIFLSGQPFGGRNENQ
jgi:hypothetical protein